MSIIKYFYSLFEPIESKERSERFRIEEDIVTYATGIIYSISILVCLIGIQFVFNLIAKLFQPIKLLTLVCVFLLSSIPISVFIQYLLNMYYSMNWTGYNFADSEYGLLSLKLLVYMFLSLITVALSCITFVWFDLNTKNKIENLST